MLPIRSPQPGRRQDAEPGRGTTAPVPLVADPGARGRVSAEVLEAGAREPRWSPRWRSWPRRRRRAATAVAGLGAAAALVATGVLPIGASLGGGSPPPVDLGATLEYSARSSPPPGGTISYYLAVRNAGTAAVTVTAAAAPHESIPLRSRGDLPRRVEPGADLRVPVSARLTCPGPGAVPGAVPGTASGSGEAGSTVPLTFDVRRDDGSTTTATVPLAAERLDRLTEMLCAGDPGLRDLELSGPVLLGPAEAAGR